MTLLPWVGQNNVDYFSSEFLLIAPLSIMPMGLHIVPNASYEPRKSAINVFNVLVFTFVRKKSDILAVYAE